MLVEFLFLFSPLKNLGFHVKIFFSELNILKLSLTNDLSEKSDHLSS